MSSVQGLYCPRHDIRFVSHCNRCFEETAGSPIYPAETLRKAGANPKDLVGATKLPVLGIVPPASIIGEAEAMRDGAIKYGPYNWRDQKIQAMTYVDANQRHILAWVDGEDLAPDSLVHHLKHAKASLGILIDAIENDTWIDNRPKKGVAAQLLAAAVRSK